MARGKGFARQETQFSPPTDDLHTPNVQRINDGIVLTEHDESNGPSLEQHLLAGRPVLSSSYAELITSQLRYIGYPDKTIESNRSAHVVGFGRIAVKGLRDYDHLSVAVKPFLRPGGALQEMQGYERLISMGLNSYEPVGIFPSLRRSHFIAITKKREDLMSLDRDTWVVGSMPDTANAVETLERNESTVVRISQTMATIHSLGYFHPDGQIKNWATTPAGEIKVIDTENYVELPLDHDKSVDLAWDDIDKLCKSLIIDSSSEEQKIFGVGLFAHMPLDRIRENIERLIVNPYRDKLYALTNHTGVNLDCTSATRMTHLEALIDGISERFKNRNDWPGNYIAFDKTTSTIQ